MSTLLKLRLIIPNPIVQITNGDLWWGWEIVLPLPTPSMLAYSIPPVLPLPDTEISRASAASGTKKG